MLGMAPGCGGCGGVPGLQLGGQAGEWSQAHRVPGGKG